MFQTITKTYAADQQAFVVGQFRSDMRDVDIHGPVYDKWGVQPKRLDDLAASEKYPLILDQERQDLIFLS